MENMTYDILKKPPQEKKPINSSQLVIGMVACVLYQSKQLLINYPLRKSIMEYEKGTNHPDKVLKMKSKFLKLFKNPKKATLGRCFAVIFSVNLNTSTSKNTSR